MKTYNKLMLNFWLFMSIFLFVIITYKGINEGFRNWSFYYVLSIIAFLMYIIRKWMMKRMEKHQKFLSDQRNKKTSS